MTKRNQVPVQSGKIPLLLLFAIAVIICLPFSAMAQQFDVEHSKVYKRKGYKFILGDRGRDSMIVIDPATGQEIVKTTKGSPQPFSVNGTRIFKLTEITSPSQYPGGANSLEEYLLANLKDDILALDADNITMRLNLHNVIVNEQGKIVYYEFSGIKAWDKNGHFMSPDSKRIALTLNRLMSETPAMKPATHNSTNVPAYVKAALSYYEIKKSGTEISHNKTDRRIYGNR